MTMRAAIGILAVLTPIAAGAADSADRRDMHRQQPVLFRGHRTPYLDALMRADDSKVPLAADVRRTNQRGDGAPINPGRTIVGAAAMRDSIRREQLTSRSEVRLVTDEARHQVIALWDGVHQPDTRIAVKDRMTIEDGLIKDFEVISLVHRKAAEPKPEPAPVLTGDAEAVAPLIEALRDVARHVWSLPYATSSDVARRNTESYLAGLFSQAWSFSQQIEMLGVPYFSRGAKVEGLPGLYNPDNIYSSALLDPTGAYRIYGRRGSHTDLSFQVVDQYPILGLGENLAVIRPDTAAAKPGDEFEFYLGGTERDGENWHPMPDHAVAILARQTFGDWRAVPTSLHIERLDRPVPRAHENAFAQAASGLRQAARLWVDGYVPGLERSTMTNALPALKPAVTDKAVSADRRTSCRATESTATRCC